MPPRSRGGGDTGGIRIVAKIDASKATAEFKEARREIDNRTRDGLKRAGEKVALPEAKRRAGDLAVTTLKGGKRSTASSLTVKTTKRDAQLTTTIRGKEGRAVGLQEFGGTVTTTIRPRKAQALTVGSGFAAYVDTPRHYKGKRFMTGAVESKQREIRQAMLEEVLDAFDGFAVS